MLHFWLHDHLVHRTGDLRLNAIRQASDVRRQSSPTAQSRPAKRLYDLRLRLSGDLDVCGSLARVPTENEPGQTTESRRNQIPQPTKLHDHSCTDPACSGYRHLLRQANRSSMYVICEPTLCLPKNCLNRMSDLHTSWKVMIQNYSSADELKAAIPAFVSESDDSSNERVQFSDKKPQFIARKRTDLVQANKDFHPFFA